MQEGIARQIEGWWEWEPGRTRHAIQFGEFWPLNIEPTLGSRTRSLPTDRYVPCSVDLLWSGGRLELLAPSDGPAFQNTLRGAMPAQIAAGGAQDVLECANLIKNGVPPQLAPRILSEPHPAPSLSLPVFNPSLVSGLPDSPFTGALPASVAPMASLPKGSALPAFGFATSATPKVMEGAAQANVPGVQKAVAGAPAEIALRIVQPVTAGMASGEVRPVLPTAKGLAPAETRIAFPENLRTEVRCVLAQSPADTGFVCVSTPEPVAFEGPHTVALPRIGDALGVANTSANAVSSLVPIAEGPGRPGIPGGIPAWPNPAAAMPGPVSSMAPVAVDPRAAINPSTLQQVAGLKFQLEDGETRPAWPNPAVAMPGPMSSPAPVAVDPPAIIPSTVQQVAGLKFQLQDGETRPGWPEPAEAEIAAAPSPDPVAKGNFGLYFPNVGRVSGLWLRPETAGLRELTWRAAEPRSALAGSVSPAPPQSHETLLPALGEGSAFRPSPGSSQVRAQWPAPVECALRIVRPLAPAAGSVSEPRLQGLGKNFEPGLSGGLSAWARLEVAPREAPASVRYVPAELASSGPSMVLSLPSGQKLATNPASGHVGSVAAPGPNPVEAMPTIAAFAPFRVNGKRAVQLPVIVLPQHATGLARSGAHGSLPHAAAPEAGEHNPKAPILRPLSVVKVDPLAIPTDHRDPVIPQPGIIPIEFHCQRGTVAPQRRLEWTTPGTIPAWPAFTMKIAADKADAPTVRPAAPKPQEEQPKVKLAPKAKGNRWLAPAMKIAACLVLGISLWFGARELGSSGSANSGASLMANVGSAAPSASAGAPAAEQKGVFAKVRNAIAGRAASTVGDTLQAGMKDWGAEGKGWAPGWTRSAAGYVHPGELALFHPTLKYTDYRLEFFGQVENHGMGWVVRAQDKQNYYAMKVSVLQAGLRPVIAMTHYPVVNGQRGHKVETPLSVMVHNNTPIHVAVDVQGNRLTASVEGQTVDSWVDDMMPAGGVGFFSEAGEKARLYWMKVTRNQDFLGTICGYLSGNSGNQDTAELWGPRAPADIPGPSAPAEPRDAVLAEVEPATRFSSSPLRAKTV